MKVFISHSWKNKTVAQKIADELKVAGADLWLDANNLLPGQLIQETIDDVLEKVDVVVLIWTKEASESGGVAAEIFTCSRLKSIIIPCKIDDTPLDIHPHLRQVKGISFKDFNDGLGRLKMVLFNYMTRDFNLHDSEHVKLLNEFMGTLETANHLIHKENIKDTGSEQDKDFWIKKIGDTHDASYEKLKAEEAIGKEMMAFLNEKMSQIQAGLNDKKQIQTILEEMKAHKYAGRPDMKKIIDQVQTIYNSFNSNDTNDAIAAYKKEMETKLVSSKQQLKNSMGWLADLLFAPAYENASYFFLSSADHLQRLLQLSRQPGIHPVVADCAEELLKYIKTPGGVIDNNQYGILGYADDAYFIQSMLANLQQEALIDITTWNIDWNKIAAGSEFVFNLVGQPIKTVLDQNILQFCQALVAKHAPQPAVQQPANNDQQLADLQKAKDDLWKAKLMSLQTSMIQNPVW